MTPINKPARQKAEPLTGTESPESCCSEFYAQDWVRNLAEDIFHPGGKELTDRTIAAMRLPSHAHITDLGCGTGTTAIMLALDCGLNVSAVDINAANIERAQARAIAAGARVDFCQADAHQLPYADGELDAVLAECTFSLFKQQTKVLGEIRRVLKPGGNLAITDMATAGSLPADIAAVLAPWTCLADAVGQETYMQMFIAAGFKIQAFGNESASLISLVRMLKRKLLMLGAGAVLGNGAERFTGVPGLDLPTIRFWLDRFEAEVRSGTIRYLRFNLALA